MKILVINTGSSSLKYQVLNMNDEELLCKGLVEKIGLPDSKIKQKCGNLKFEEEHYFENHEQALKRVIELVTDEKKGCLKSMSEIDAIGHRVVHGGEDFSKSVLITDEVMKALEDNINLAPLHNPANITGIKAAQKLLPEVPQIGVFDTAFHQTMPPKAFMYALPYELYKKYKIRRYGFHGTSHRYVAKRAAELLCLRKRDIKIISAHIGNGGSVAAIQNAKVVDTSMGFTPLEGLIMGTRSGDIDPAIPIYLMRNGYSMDEVDDILNKKSGVYGISDYLSSDMRDIRAAKDDGNEKAALALDVYVYRLAKYIGSYATAMKGLDVLIFTAGVGENTIEFREKVCEYLEIFGVELDKEKNKTLNGKEGIISTDSSKVKVLIIPTDEELMIARDTKKIVENM
ncbi:acetate kinase [Oceanotoga sp. DSM 15011]|jgi:acetate kinase|uniref:Acetate kinase n=1 Tax=Oceanotoga teriensis TaxID=515440 RepID=A0AA45C598_9BACT|nr:MULTISPECIES: acetate kinase [Oceanotoga]MDN5343150.1 acetate kinase [Oceanotoga sp.]MDO7976138.1 acetate kinase [Oceanotoga teriensis]PWJ88490.1 acetate kinase [Oceanotoga teriensis]UYP00974.1 acetate kinase [Oceanotoga sp. DSM 15011]